MGKAKKKSSQPVDGHFLTFGASLEALLARQVYDRKGDSTSRQKTQVETLIALEKVFRETLIADWRGPGVYKAFIKYISETRRNILDARPYYRERQDIFKTEISPALRHKQDKALYKYNINYQFIAFAMRVGGFSPGSRVAKAARAVMEIRQELIESNIALAISRARIFRGRNQRSHLTYMDLVQIANEGLISAVDKFVLPYTKVFRSVVIGRAVGNLIESSTETLLHFYPSDKRVIYRSNKVNRDPEAPDWDKCVLAANVDSDEKHLTNAENIQKLMLAASHVSMDITSGDEEVTKVYDSYAADESTRPDFQAEAADLRQKLYQGLDTLVGVERKILIMKGLPIT